MNQGGSTLESLGFLLIGIGLLTLVFRKLYFIFKKKSEGISWGLGLSWALGFSFLWTSIQFPAVMSNDSWMVLKEATTGHYDGQHPVILALLMRVFYLLFGLRLEFYTLFQSILLYAGVFFLLKTIADLSNFKAKLFAKSLIGMSLYTPLWIYSVTQWKDTFLAIQFLFLVSFFLRFSTRLTWKSLGPIWIFIALTVMARHNAILLLAPFTFILYFWEYKAKRFPFFSLSSFKTAIFYFLFCLSAGSLSGLLNKATGADPSRFRNSMFYTNFASWVTAHHRAGRPPDPEAYDFWNKALSRPDGYDYLVRRDAACGDEWSYIMDPNLDTSATLKTLETVPGGLKGLILRFAKNHPRTIFDYLLCNTRRLTEGTGAAHYWHHKGMSDNEFGIVHRPLSEKLVHVVEKIIDFEYMIGISEHWIFLDIAFVMLLFYFVPRLSRKDFLKKIFPLSREIYLLVPAISLSYYGGFLIVPAATDWRYLFPTTLLIVITLLCGGLLLAENFNTQKLSQKPKKATV